MPASALPAMAIVPLSIVLSVAPVETDLWWRSKNPGSAQKASHDTTVPARPRHHTQPPSIATIHVAQHADAQHAELEGFRQCL